MDVSDAGKTAEAFLKISSVYKEDNNEVKNAVLDSIGETLRSLSSFIWLLINLPLLTDEEEMLKSLFIYWFVCFIDAIFLV